MEVKFNYLIKNHFNIISDTFGGIVKVLGGNLGFQIFSFLITIILARTLDKYSFANFMICLVTIELIRFLSQFGLKPTVVQYAFRESNKNTYLNTLLGCYLFLSLGISFIIFILFFLFSYYISLYILKDVSLSTLIKIVGINAISITIFEVYITNLNIKGYFGTIAKYSIALGLIRLALVCLGLYFFPGNLALILAGWVLSPFLVSIWNWRFYWELINYYSGWSAWIKSLLGFSRWVFLAAFLAVLTSRLDFYLLNWQQIKGEIADYGVALTLAGVMKIYSGSASTVILPQMCRTKLHQDLLKKQIIMVANVALWGLLIVLPIGIFGRLAIKIIYGADFIGAYLPTLLLAIGFLFFVFQDNLALIFIARGRPELKVLNNLLQIIILFIIGVLLIPKLLAVGAALSVILCQILSGLITIFMLKIMNKKLN